MLSSYILPAVIMAGVAYARPTKLALPPAFFLAGDSTTAPDGGWGDAFVASLTSNSTGTNSGHSGATTGSFRSDATRTSTYTPYVTIQFGHNDQKTDAGVATFLDNLVQFDKDVRDAGGQPIFFTSLTRRSFGDDETVVDDLANVRELTIQAAEKTGALWADLNTVSREYVNAIGEENAHTYNLAEDDNTHLNEAGGIVFAGIVGLLLKGPNADFDQYIRIESELVAAVEAGEYYYPVL
ncbi:SGNH hydrolase-type esterase domain-containing protein [Aspergillus varians]